MDYYSNQITQLIEELGKLPGIGPKSAGRLAFHIINMPQDQVKKLSDTIISAKTNVHYCKECCTLTDNEICPICASDKRDHSTIMVVENTRDLMAYEKTGKYEGVYHVLHGAISPMLGIGPDDIRLLLGHSDVNTTRKHYAAIAEDHRRIAAQKTVLREEPVHPKSPE